MSFKKWLNAFMPPIVWWWLKKVQKKQKPSYIWEGVYENFDKIGNAGQDYFETESWSQEALKEIRRIKEDCTKSKLPSVFASGEQGYLPLLLASLKGKKKKLKVLDFGGGMGADYQYVSNTLESSDFVEYVIVDSKAVVDVGNRFYVKDKRVRLLEKLPVKTKKFDVVHVDTALQYIEDYSKLIEKLTRYKAEYILLVRVSAGHFPTFASMQQNMPGMRTPYWFLNIDELKELVEKGGYKLLFWNMSESVYNQDNFEDKYRMERPMNLLFRRIAKEKGEKR